MTRDAVINKILGARITLIELKGELPQLPPEARKEAEKAVTELKADAVELNLLARALYYEVSQSNRGRPRKNPGRFSKGSGE